MSRLSATSVFFLEPPRLKAPADGDRTGNADRSLTRNEARS